MHKDIWINGPRSDIMSSPLNLNVIPVEVHVDRVGLQHVLMCRSPCRARTIASNCPICSDHPTRVSFHVQCKQVTISIYSDIHECPKPCGASRPVPSIRTHPTTTKTEVCSWHTKYRKIPSERNPIQNIRFHSLSFTRRNQNSCLQRTHFSPINTLSDCKVTMNRLGRYASLKHSVLGVSCQ